MAFKIGFAAEFLENKRMESKSAVPEPAAAPRRSMVQVYFAERNMNLAYYNDQFDLHCGDTVYVDGKLEGMRGRVTQVSYNFKIKVSDYKRVIAVADTAVNGRFLWQAATSSRSTERRCRAVRLSPGTRRRQRRTMRSSAAAMIPHSVWMTSGE